MFLCKSGSWTACKAFKIFCSFNCIITSRRDLSFHEAESAGAGGNAHRKTGNGVNGEHPHLAALQQGEVFIGKRAERRKAAAEARHEEQLQVRRKRIALEEHPGEKPDEEAAANIRGKSGPREPRHLRDDEPQEIAQHTAERTTNCNK